VAIVDEGRIIAMGTPREIQDRAAGESTIEIECAAPLDGAALPAWRDADKVSLDEGRTRVSVVSRRPARSMVDMMKWLDEKGIELADIRIRRPSLEDAFIELTGKSLRE
jgi:ABC-2 type transport system ATP-binding protein